MFYAIRELLNEDGDPTGEVWVAQAADPDCISRPGLRNFKSAEEAKAHYGMVNWTEPSTDAAPDVLAEGCDE